MLVNDSARCHYFKRLLISSLFYLDLCPSIDSFLYTAYVQSSGPRAVALMLPDIHISGLHLLVTLLSNNMDIVIYDIFSLRISLFGHNLYATR
ncbi:protein of unknown function [Moritella yayanosii]|uniref:Uncharacterized protein n=1 Tax=Moritella yayanosii TaxID=69539 RepID=A0A330LRQ7_9GAMM|nr:protein of unknown function [Moritella yayanosii]